MVTLRSAKPTCAGSIPAHASTARVAKLVDAPDLKSVGRKAMRVRFPPWAHKQIFLCPGGEIGRRTSLRSWRGDPWRFESSPGHTRKQKSAHLRCAPFLFSCAPGRNRTYDRLLKRQLLYQLSYGCIPGH